MHCRFLRGSSQIVVPIWALIWLRLLGQVLSFRLGLDFAPSHVLARRGAIHFTLLCSVRVLAIPCIFVL